MSDRKGKYIKPGKGATVPGSLFTLSVGTRVRRQGVGGRIIARTFACAVVTHCVRRRGKWGAVSEWHYFTPQDTLECLNKRAVIGRTNWVVCEVASDVLTLLRWWDYAEAQGVVWRGTRGARQDRVEVRSLVSPIVFGALVVRGVPDIVGYTHRGRSWRWVSGRQYLPAGLGDYVAGDPAGGRDPCGDRTRASTPLARAERTARGWSDRFREITDWWSRHAKAPFGMTCGQLSVGMLRSYAPPKSLCTHGDEDVHRLERSAAFGGRASTWYIGHVGPQRAFPRQVVTSDGHTYHQEIDGPVYLADVQSMYPSIMRDHAFPDQLRRLITAPPVRYLLELCTHYGIIARVRIRTSVPEYPYRTNESVIYPIGEFTTVLTGPELVELSKHGEIIECYEAAMYRMSHCLSAVSTHLLELREEYGRKNDEVGRSFAKLLGNGLAGKFAQRSGGWERYQDGDQKGQWGESCRLNMQTGVRTKYRHIAGLCWRWHDDETGAGPHTAVFCYIASYGRLMMRSIRQALPARSVVSQDTDGLWLLTDGYTAARSTGLLAGAGPGRLSIRATGHSGQWYGPRHYHVDGRWTLAGFHNPVMSEEGQTITDSFRATMWSAKFRSAPDCTLEYERTSQLKLEIGSGRVQPDGWVLPPVRTMGRTDEKTAA